MARIVGGIGISHQPAMGREFDRVAKQGEPLERWQAWFDGSRRVGELLDQLAPDHIVIVYNDHLNHFDLENYPTFAIGIGASFPQADEGGGLRALPEIPGDPGWGIHLTEHLVENGFDMTVSQNLAIDHGIYSWLPYLSAPPWRVPITPIAVNMIRQPLPAPFRLRQLGEALRRGIEGRIVDQRVVVVATGGLSHQISGGRFGLVNAALDTYLMDRLPRHLDELVSIPTREWMRLGGMDAAELTMWFSMRAALSASARPVFSFHTAPSIVGAGALVLAEPGELTEVDAQLVSPSPSVP